MTEILNTLFNALVLIFVLTSMFGLGLGLTLKQVIAPMKKTSLMAKALVANFILAPLLAFVLAKLIRLDDPFAIGLIILAVSAGAPMLAKYAEMAKGDSAFTLGLMILLMVVTIIYAPIVLPLLIPGVHVDVWGMVKSLMITMLLPLGAGLFIKARYESLAETLSPHMAQASSFTLIAQLVLAIPLASGDLMKMLGTGAIITLLLFIVGTMAIGYLLGGPKKETRIVTALGTGQRNVSAALLIAVQNFVDPKVLLMVMTGALVMMVINMLTASEFGKHAKVASSSKQ
ncbi:MAG TPA: bile acid:sodium symporter family protein [Anaerolineales bacterium]|nr:bile acid:sodium symporter family protein [Anaerolineales bacterium]